MQQCDHNACYCCQPVLAQGCRGGWRGRKHNGWMQTLPGHLRLPRHATMHCISVTSHTISQPLFQPHTQPNRTRPYSSRFSRLSRLPLSSASPLFSSPSSLTSDRSHHVSVSRAVHCGGDPSRPALVSCLSPASSLRQPHPHLPLRQRQLPHHVHLLRARHLSHH